MPPRFVQQVARGLEALGQPKALLLAVSGGADSVAMLHALSDAGGRRALSGVRLVVGHVDHRLRAESAQDAALVEAHAARLGLPFTLERLDFSELSNLEERAREARYAALIRMTLAHGCEALATAHTATDQAETLLWRLTRGAGARGLSGMAPERPLEAVRLLRPLLAVTRDETRAFCQERGLAFHDDPTNEDDRPRARLRAEVLPVLERLVPGAVRHLAEAAARLRADDAHLESLRPEAEEQPSLGSLRALAEPLRARSLADWAARATGSRRRLSATHVEALGRLVVSGRGEVELPASAVERRVALVRDGCLAVEVRSRGTTGS
jgi:tRNA(Ile)-lysidine synthase